MALLHKKTGNVKDKTPYCPITPSDSTLGYSPLKFWRLSLSPHRNSKPLKHEMRSPGQIRSVVISGMQTCTLKSLGLTSLHGIGVHPEVKRLYLQQNQLSSFEGWVCQPDLAELNAEDNKIENFR